MPIYEYRCTSCQRKASLFFRSIAVADTDPACPHCGHHDLQRLMSRVWSGRSTNADDAFLTPSYEEDGVPFYGPNPYDDPFDMGHESGDTGVEDDGSTEDVAAMAREARSMAQMMGEPLDAAFDNALRHVERGADPEDVFGELDAKESAQNPPEPQSEP